MTYLVASQFLLWLAVIVLAGICIALARQVGVLHERIAPAGALAINKRLVAGSLAPELDASALNGAALRIGGVRDRRSQLLFFLSPTCPVCKTLLPALKSAALAESHWLDVVLASDGELSLQRKFVQEQGLGRFDYVSSEQLGRAFGVSKLPYAVLIDGSGRIAAFGIVNSREHLESLFEAAERDVPSIQQYLARS